MGIDKTTKPTVYLSIKKDTELLKRAEKNNIANMGDKEHKEDPAYLIDGDIETIDCEEYYFDDEDGSIHFTGQSPSEKVYIGFDIKLSDEVLIDVIQHSIKRLNKLKTALESLK